MMKKYIIYAIITIIIFRCACVCANTIGYGTDMTYDTAATSNTGTFPIANIKAVFNNASKPSTAGTGTAVQKTASYEDEGNTSGSAVYTYSDQSTGTVSVAADLEANRTNDGTYGLKYDFTQAKNAEGIALSTKEKATDGTRDLYFSVWIKPLKADGTLAEYSTNSISTSIFTERSNAPFGIYLTYTDANGKAAGSMFLSEANAIEETTADGWRKISAIIPAAYAKSIKFTMYAINYTDNENSHGYGTANRSYLLVDDIYLAEIPTSIAWNSEGSYDTGGSVLSLSDLFIRAYDANADISYITTDNNVKYTVVGEAYIYENDLIYTGSEDGAVTVTATVISKSTSQKSIYFKINEEPSEIGHAKRTNYGYGLDISYHPNKWNTYMNGTFEWSDNSYMLFTGGRYVTQFDDEWKTEYLPTSEYGTIYNNNTVISLCGEAARTGRRGLKLNLSALENKQGIRMITKNLLKYPSSDLPFINHFNRDLYIEFWYKADGTPYNGIPAVSALGFKGVPLSLSINQSNSFIVTEEQSSEEDDNGWKKMSLTVLAEKMSEMSEFYIAIWAVKNDETISKDRTYVYIDDYYVTERPRSIAFEASGKKNFEASDTPHLSSFVLKGLDINGVEEKIAYDNPRLKWSVLSNNAVIENDRLKYIGGETDNGLVELKVEFLTLEATLTVSFGEILSITNVYASEDGAYCADITNKSPISYDASIITCVFDNYNELKKYYNTSVTVGGYESKTVRIENVNISDVSSPVVKMFLWNDIYGMYPLAFNKNVGNDD